MADTPPESEIGWWQASDGKWYPPEDQPDDRPPPPPSKAAGGAPKKPESLGCGWMLGLVGALFAVLLVVSLFNHRSSSTADDDISASNETTTTLDTTVAALDLAWANMSASSRADLCVGLKTYGLERATDLLMSGGSTVDNGFTLDRDSAQAWLFDAQTSKCS